MNEIVAPPHDPNTLRLASLADHTIVIPTYNRPALLLRLVTYYAEHGRPIRLLVLDSSKPDIAAENATALEPYRAFLRHVVYPTTTPMAAKLSLGLQDVSTSTVSFCADDDLVFTDGLHEARNFLLGNPDYVCAHGLYLNFREDGFQLHLTREYAGESNDAKHPGARIFRLCQNYESLFYGLFRTADLRDILAVAGTIPSLHYQELFQSVGALIKGKIKRLQCFYAARRSGPEAEPSRERWQTYYWFADNPTEFLQHYADYRNRAASFYTTHGAAPQLNRSDFQRVLDVTHAIYFSKTCPPEYFHTRLQAYWPDDGFVKEQADLFHLMRSERAPPRHGTAARLARKLLRGLRVFRARVGPVAPIDQDIQQYCRHPWVCQLPRRMKWLAADKGFRAAYRELCVYLDANLSSSGPMAEQIFRTGDRVINNDGKPTITTSGGRPITLVGGSSGTGELVGAVEAANIEGDGQVVLQGWAVDPGVVSPAGSVIVIMRDRIAAWGIPQSPRADIAGGFGASCANCGFRVHLPQVLPADLKEARVYAALADGNARELRYAAGVRDSSGHNGAQVSSPSSLPDLGPIGPRYLPYLATSAVIWISLFLAFTWTVDPYGVSPIHLAIPGVNQFKPRRVDIDRVIKPYEVWRYQPSTIFLGSSRIHQSIDPSVLDGTKFAPAYNASVPANSLGMNISYLEQYVKLDRNLHTIFAELFLYNFLGQTQEHPDNTWSEFIANGMKLFGSSDALWDSIYTLAENESGRKQTYEIAPGGYFYYPPGHQSGDVFNGFPAGAIQLYLRSNGGPKLRQEAFDAVRELASLARAHNIELSFIATPNHAYFDYYIDAFDLWGMVEEWLRRLSGEVRVYSFSQPNDWVYEPVRPFMKYWNDPFHFSLEMGRGIQTSLAGLSLPDLPDNFMMRLTPDNVAAHVASRREAIRLWAKDHPAFVEEFDRERRKALGLPASHPEIQTPQVGSHDFRVGDKVTREGDKVYVTAIDGKKVELINRAPGSTESFGAIENVSFPPLALTGWAIDPSAHAPAQIIAIVRNRIWAWGEPSMKRPDIAGGFGASFEQSGFSIPVPAGSATDAREMRAYAIMQDGTARELGYAPSIGNSEFIEQSDIERGQTTTTNSPFKIGDQVKREGDKVYVTAIDGKKVELINRAPGSTESFGAIENVSFPPLALTGWAIDPSTHAPAQIIAIVRNRIWAWGEPSMKRPDIAGGFGASFEQSGFFIPVPAGSATDAREMRAYAIMQDGTARELGYAPSIGNSEFIEQSDIERGGTTNWPFKIGDQVKREGDKVYVTAIDGKKIELINRAPGSTELFGAIENVSFPPLALTGWAIDPGAHAPAQMIAIVKNRIWAWGEPSMKRPDIAGGFGASFEQSGFFIPVPAGSATDAREMRAYAIMQDGTARELSYAASIGNSGAR
jgi:glycosyltransferase domain-containing protein